MSNTSQSPHDDADNPSGSSPSNGSGSGADAPSPRERVKPSEELGIAVIWIVVLLLPIFVLLFVILPATIYTLMLLDMEFWAYEFHEVPTTVQTLLTGVGCMAVVTVVLAALLKRVGRPQPWLDGLLLMLALAAAMVQGTALSLLFGGRIGAALGAEIGPTELKDFRRGLFSFAAYLHLVAVALPLSLATQWPSSTGSPKPSRPRKPPRPARPRAGVFHRWGPGSGTTLSERLDLTSGGPHPPRTQPCPEPDSASEGSPGTTAGPGTSEDPTAHTSPRSALRWAGAALAVAVLVSTLATFESRRRDTAQQIAEYTASIAAYPYPLALLDAPGWRIHGLGFSDDHSRFAAVYINDNREKLAVSTLAEEPYTYNCVDPSVVMDQYRDGADGREDTDRDGTGATDGADGTDEADDEGTRVGPGWPEDESGEGDINHNGTEDRFEPMCDITQVELSGLNEDRSAFEAFETRLIVADLDGRSRGETTAMLDLRALGAEGYEEVAAAVAEERRKEGRTDRTPEEVETGPVVVVAGAVRPKPPWALFRPPETFDIPASEIKDAAPHVVLLNPDDSEAVRELAYTAHLAR